MSKDIIQKVPSLPAAYKQPKLSTNVSQMQPYYDVVVIGSGYGGSIAANRLSRSAKRDVDGVSWMPLSIAVLERGKEWSTGSFPETEIHALQEVQMSKNDVNFRLGETDHLFHINSGDDITVIKGCGLGGTSLINANVALETVPAVFESKAWPAELREPGVLDKYYGRARDMLSPEIHPHDRKKTQALRKSAGGILKHFDFDFNANTKDIEDLEQLSKMAEDMKLFYKTPINVNNTDYKDGNKCGVSQQACNACGNCVSGCNVGAKNTCMMNYLPDARARGVEMFTSIYVKHIKRDPNGAWFVFYSIQQGSFEAHDLFVRAGNVIVSGGALGSTETLLRSRREGMDLSDKVGYGFTGNGDMIGFSYKGKTSVNSIGEEEEHVQHPVKSPGPCITAIIDMRAIGRAKKDPTKGLLLEDGTPPGILTSMFWPLVMASGFFNGDVSNPVDFMRRIGRDHLDCTLAYLCMSHDDSGGQMTLRSDGRGVVLKWDKVGKQEQFEIDNHATTIGAKVLDGKPVRNPVWAKSLGSQLLTVHPLGGCIMGSDHKTGVVNHKGQVYAPSAGEDAVHNGLYVMDGAVMPTSLGVNPLLTISAVSERNIELMIQDKGWKPMDLGFQGTKNREVLNKMMAVKAGVLFSERMAGYVVDANAVASADLQTKDWDRPFKANWGPVEKVDKSQRVAAEFTLTINSDDVEHMIADKNHFAQTAGVFICPLLSTQPMTVRQGKFQLFPNSDYEKDTKLMIYTFFADSIEGEMFYFRGTKFVHKDHFWEIGIKDTTTLFITVHKVVEKKLPPGPCRVLGVLTIAVSDFGKQLRTMQITNCPNTEVRLGKLSKFVEYFADSTLNVYSPMARRLNRMFSSEEAKERDEVVWAPRVRRPLKLGDVVPEVYPVPTGDYVDIGKHGETESVEVIVRLTRFRGGNKGPVLVIPGYGVDTGMFTCDTIETSFVEYFVPKGYDIWLFDWRAAISLPWCHTQFTLDQCARYDFPAAVRKVLEVTERKDIQVMCHCVGSITFHMSLLAGFIPRNHIRTVCVSQVAFHCIAHTTFSKAGSFLNLPGLMHKLDMTGTDTKEHATDSIEDQMLSKMANKVGALRALPFANQGCDSHACHCITFSYGLLYMHENLNPTTHKVLDELFGFAGLEAITQLSRCIANVHPLCSFKNDKSPNKPFYNQYKNLTAPTLYYSGAENYCFDPKATLESFRVARQVQPLCERVVVAGYGHFDHFIGNNAAVDCWPHFDAYFEKHQSYALTPEVEKAADTFTYVPSKHCCVAL